MKKNQSILLTLLAIFSLSACMGQKKGKEEPVGLNTEIDSVSYGIGVSIAKNLQKDGLDNIDVSLLSKGLSDVFEAKDLMVSPEDAMAKIQAYVAEKQKVKQAESIEKGKLFLEENSKKEGVVTLPSGLQYKILKEGTGPKPTADDQVETHYTGTLIDGTVFDSSVERGEPITFAVGGVIPGWTEALQLMPVGSKWQLFVPSDLAYGERGAGGQIGPNETLIFEIELLSIPEAVAK
jgi:FKBP-type peptidyl-prolyl cis-trans isomerase FklB